MSTITKSKAPTAAWEAACIKLSEAVEHMLGPSGRRKVDRDGQFLDFALDLATGLVDVQRE